MTAALLDRLVHRSTILSLVGESYRFRQSLQRHTLTTAPHEVPTERREVPAD